MVGFTNTPSSLPQPPVTGLDELGREEELNGTDEEAGEVERERESAHGHRHLVHCHRLLDRQKIHSRLTFMCLFSYFEQEETWQIALYLTNDFLIMYLQN